MKEFWATAKFWRIYVFESKSKLVRDVFWRALNGALDEPIEQNG